MTAEASKIDAPARSTRADLVGMAAMAGGNILLIVNDTMVKLAAGTLPMSEVIFLRGAASIALLYLVLQVQTGGVARLPRLSLPLMLRALFEVGTSFSYLYALQLIPIGDLAGLQQVTPLALLAGAAIAFRERIGWQGWLASMVGLGGALLIVQPWRGGGDAASNAATLGAMLAILAVVFQVIRDLMTRALPTALPPAFVAATSQMAMVLGGLCLAPFDGWGLPTADAGFKIFGAAAFLSLANIWLVMAMQSGRLSVVAPFRYAGLLAALAAGWIVWGEFPDMLSLAGSAIITASGLYSLWRGRQPDGGKVLSTEAQR